MSRYQLAKWFGLRMTGFPVENLHALVSRPIGRATSGYLAALQAVAERADALDAELGEAGAPRKVLRRLRARRTLGKHAARLEGHSADVAAYEAALDECDQARAALRETYATERERMHEGLAELVSDERFRHVLLLSSPSLIDRLQPRPIASPSKRRALEATWAAYVQRLTTKNETISFFGPSAWGAVDRDESRPVAIELEDHLERRVHVERWVCDDLVAAMTNDPEAPDPEPLPATPTPFALLRQRLASWPDSPVRQKWQHNLEAIETHRARIERDVEVSARRDALEAMSETLSAMGVRTTKGGKALYTSRLPIVEDCAQGTARCAAGAPLVQQLEEDLAPWYGYWEDLAGTYAAALIDALAPIWRGCSDGDPTPLPAFLDAAAAERLDLRRTGGVGLPRGLETKIQRAWDEQLGDRAEDEQVSLTADDVTFLRRHFRVRPIGGYLGWPAPDVQVAMRPGSTEWTAILSEIHPSQTLWNFGRLQFCPEPDDLRRFYAGDEGEPPRVLHYSDAGFFDGSVHMVVLAPRELGGWTFTRGKGMEGVRQVPADRILVHLEDDDLVARDDQGEELGSLIDNWLVASSTHRLELLGTGMHSPRLVVGRVVVQRRSWLVDVGSIFPDGHVRGGVEGLEAIRSALAELPDEVFARPVLAMQGTHHPDAKPVFVDFRSPFLVDLLASMMRKYQRIRFVEMLPKTDECWLRDQRGHYSCELRFAARPRGRGRS